MFLGMGFTAIAYLSILSQLLHEYYLPAPYVPETSPFNSFSVASLDKVIFEKTGKWRFFQFFLSCFLQAGREAVGQRAVPFNSFSVASAAAPGAGDEAEGEGALLFQFFLSCFPAWLDPKPPRRLNFQFFLSCFEG